MSLLHQDKQEPCETSTPRSRNNTYPEVETSLASFSSADILPASHYSLQTFTTVSKAYRFTIEMATAVVPWDQRPEYLAYTDWTPIPGVTSYGKHISLAF